MKPLGRKNYGSIGHLPNSRLGPGDHKVTEGQARIATEKVRDKHDFVVVQEKLDGSNVGVCRVRGEIIALGRAGYRAGSSQYDQHKLFAKWVAEHESLFRKILGEGERVCGEWIALAHGTEYRLKHEPFIAFDFFKADNERIPWSDFRYWCRDFVMPTVLSYGEPISVETALERLGDFGFHGAKDRVEGAVWRVERKGKVDFLCKYVRHDKEDGKYFAEVNGSDVWNVAL